MPRFTTSSSSKPLLSAIEAVNGSGSSNDSVPTLECAKPPSALLELLEIPPGLTVDNDDGTLSLRHPSVLLMQGLSVSSCDTTSDYSFTSQAELLYYTDVYELLSQRKLRQVCLLPSTTTTTTTTTTCTEFLQYKIQCMERDCPFQLCYRREKIVPIGINLRHMEVLPWDDTATIGHQQDAAAPVDLDISHTCQPIIMEWNKDGNYWNRKDTTDIGTLDVETGVEEDEKKTALPRNSGYAPSTILLNAIVVRYLLLQRQIKGPPIQDDELMLHCYHAFQKDTGLVLSPNRFQRGCSLYRKVVKAFPTPSQEDPTICSDTFGLWSLGMATKTLPNSYLKLAVPSGAPSLQDPLLEACWQKAMKKLVLFTVCGLKSVCGMLLIYGFAIFVGYPTIGPMLLATGLWGPAWFTRTAERYQRDGIPVTGYISDRILVSRGNGLLARLCWNRHGLLVITFVEHDGEVGHRMVYQNTLQECDTIQESIGIVPMLQLSNATNSAFPTETLSQRGYNCKVWFKRCLFIFVGLFWVGFVLSLIGDGNVVGQAVLILSQLAVFGALWKIDPPDHFGFDPTVQSRYLDWKGYVGVLFESMIYRSCGDYMY